MSDLRRAFAGVAGLLLVFATAPASANPFIIENEQPAFTASFAARYWYGMGSTGKDLYDTTGSILVSRLTYDDLQTHSLEGLIRVDHSSGLFWKGYVGGGLLAGGTLNDEDFPPAITPYSSTLSDLNQQNLGYASIDVGGALLRGPDFRVDAFVGYHYLYERMKAFGCTQIAGNSSICGTPIDNSVAVIEQQNTWQALRVGLNADVPLFDRLRLNVDAAYLPYVWFSGNDSHLLRIGSTTGAFTGAIPEDGHGWGYQIDAVLTYSIDDNISIGIGGRYWHEEASGYAHFEDHVVNTVAAAQVLDWKTDHYGVFLQGTYRFDPF
jgi:outer membrane protease